MIYEKDLEGASVREVEEDNLLTALRKREGVDVPLPDLVEFMDILPAETNMEPGGQIDRGC